MTSWGDAQGLSPKRSRDDDSSSPWLRVGVVVAVLLLAFAVSRGCQQAQVRITKEQAIATAKDEVEFTPTATQIRFLRQGINRQPFWFVSLSIPLSEAREAFTELAVVKVNANNGKVEEIEEGETVGADEAEVSVTEQEALAAAVEAVEFTPERTGVKLLRQGEDVRPLWLVTLTSSGVKGSQRRAVIRVDASSGEVEDVTEGQGAR